MLFVLLIGYNYQKNKTFHTFGLSETFFLLNFVKYFFTFLFTHTPYQQLAIKQLPLPPLNLILLKNNQLTKTFAGMRLTEKNLAMKKNQNYRFFTLLLILSLAFSVSSCNRGVGCPSNFSVQGMISNVSTSVVYLFR